MTKDWELYIAGKNYNNRLEPNYYDTVDANLAFFNGDQWRNVNAENMPKPVFNIIKRVNTFFVASLTSSKTKIHFEPLTYADDTEETPETNASDVANAQVATLFDKFKMEYKIKDILFDAINTGDGCIHYYFDVTKRPYIGTYDANIKGEICEEIIDGSNVFFGNANNPNVDVQPYIIIAGRDMVQNLKEEAKRYKTEKQDIDQIDRDYNYEEQSGDAGKIEVEADEYGKALYIIVYRKEKKKRKVKDEFGQETTEEYTTITASKSVENAYVYKDIDTGLERYPIAWMNWEKQKNQYHGRALTTGVLPNQIFINRMFAMSMYHLMMTAFPKAVYNADLIQNFDNVIGSAVPIKGVGYEVNVNNVAGYLKPGDMSNQIVKVIELAMQYTKETLGISDAALGQIDPKNTSAIIAVQKSSAIPLENPKSNLYELIEDSGRILFDMMGTYYGTRPIVVEKDGQKMLQEFDFNQFKHMWLDVSADVGESSYWSELASIETLDNLLSNGYIEVIDYLERMPDEYIPQKQELIASIQERMEQALQQDQRQAPPQASEAPQLNVEGILTQLSPEEQQAFMSAPPEVQEQMLMQLQQAPQ